MSSWQEHWRRNNAASIVDWWKHESLEVAGHALMVLLLGPGSDEISYRKHHKYVTVVVDHDRGIVIWAAEGKSSETALRFFDALGAERCALLEAVTIGMRAAYIKAVAVNEAEPNAKLIFDRSTSPSSRSMPSTTSLAERRSERLSRPTRRS